MVEIMRSKMYYGRARVMTALPLFLPMNLDKLPTNVSDGQGGHVNVKMTVETMFLGNLLELLKSRGALSKDGKDGSSAACLAASVIGQIIEEKTICNPSYFARVWTLSERMVSLQISIDIWCF
jgi:hypothetical protein